MHEFIDAVELFAGIVNGLKRKEFTLDSSLEEMVLKTSLSRLAYIDNRRKIKDFANDSFWEGIKKRFEDHGEFISWLTAQGVRESLLYSKSEQFPDFLFKVRNKEGMIVGGSVLELKDSRGGSIASFNSTLPSTYKSLEEIDIINGNHLVSRIASIFDGELSAKPNYYTFQRRNYYLVRTHKESARVKLSIIDGSFFETIPKEHLIYQMFLNILRGHLERKDVQIPLDLLKEIEKALSHITDQTIIASSQTIAQASIRPRLRIMSEVHAEGNPHSHFYPEIIEQSFNLILHESMLEAGVVEIVTENVECVNTFLIQHKRNGKHVVFQFRL